MYNENFSEGVYTIVKKLVARTERINTFTGEIPAIEIDLALEDIRRLYDLFLLIKTMPEAHYTESEAPVNEEVTHDMEVIGEAEEEEAAEEDLMDAVQPETAEQTSNTMLHDPVLQTEVTQEEREKQSTGKILADTLRKDDLQSINDLIAVKKSDISISTRMQHNPISNLKRAIGINEKFIFVYELFGGNTQLYAETIERLNMMEGRNEAIALLETLRREYSWDIENMAFQKLVDMVSRRYS